MHFDAHPDMLFPKEADADVIFEPATLYDTVSIADWILPLVYAGHVDRVVWLKPPWCNQFYPDAVHRCSVGRHSATGELRVSCAERYFLEEGLYAEDSELQQQKSLILEVITVDPHSEDTVEFETGESLILDICLDFFAVRSPFRDDVEAYLGRKSYQALHRTYTSRKWMKDRNTAVADPSIFQEQQRAFDTVVSRLITQRAYLNTSSGASALSVTNETLLNSEIGLALRDAYEPGEAASVVSDFVSMLCECDEANRRDGISLETPLCVPNRLGDTGDTHSVPLLGLLTSLPHHDTPEAWRGDADGLLASLCDFVSSKELPQPRLVTVARSGEDHYTPPKEVGRFEKAVISACTAMVRS